MNTSQYRGSTAQNTNIQFYYCFVLAALIYSTVTPHDPMTYYLMTLQPPESITLLYYDSNDDDDEKIIVMKNSQLI